MIEKQLNLSEYALEEMDKIDYLYFNIFNVQSATNDNELVTVSSYILAKHGIFNKININFDTFMCFMKQI